MKKFTFGFIGLVFTFGFIGLLFGCSNMTTDDESSSSAGFPSKGTSLIIDYYDSGPYSRIVSYTPSDFLNNYNVTIFVTMTSAEIVSSFGKEPTSLVVEVDVSLGGYDPFSEYKQEFSFILAGTVYAEVDGKAVGYKFYQNYNRSPGLVKFTNFYIRDSFSELVTVMGGIEPPYLLNTNYVTTQYWLNGVRQY